MARVADLEARLAASEAENRRLRARVEELEAQLAKNSGNSSKPPSSDLPGNRPEKKAQKKGKKRRRGGQPGHDPHWRAAPEQVDHVHEVRARDCRHCGEDLRGGRDTGSRLDHHVFELPPIKPVVHQYQLHDVACGKCGLVTAARLPAGVPRGEYGPSVEAMTGLCRGELRLSMRQTSTLMTEVFGVPMSIGTVANVQHRVSEALAAPVAEAAAYVQQQPLIHADETSWPQDKQKAWLWVAVTQLVTVFLIRSSRGADAAKELIGEAFRGILATDRWASYGWVDAKRRQVCWSHLKRDFKSFLDYADGAALGEQLVGETRLMFRYWRRYRRDGTLTRAELKLKMRPLRTRILRLLAEGKAGSCAKVRGMCKHILKLEDSLFTFVDHDGVEPTNNTAERAIRPAVLWRKGCFGSDSEKGSRFAERILSVRATLRSQRRSLHLYLIAACEAALNKTASPSLLPAPAQCVTSHAIAA